MHLKPHLSTTRMMGLSLVVALGLTACEKAPDGAKVDAAAPASVPATINVLDELQTAPSKVFKATPDDAADIAQLTQFEQNFSAQSEQMEIELEKLQQQGQIKPHEVLDRKFHNIQQGLNSSILWRSKRSKVFIFKVYGSNIGKISNRYCVNSHKRKAVMHRPIAVPRIWATARA